MIVIKSNIEQLMNEKLQEKLQIKEILLKNSAKYIKKQNSRSEQAD